MEDRRCKLGLQGRLELVCRIESGETLSAAPRSRSAPGDMSGLRPVRCCTSMPSSCRSSVRSATGPAATEASSTRPVAWARSK